MAATPGTPDSFVAAGQPVLDVIAIDPDAVAGQRPVAVIGEIEGDPRL